MSITAAAEFAKALGTKNAVKSTKQLNESVKGINTAAKIGAFTDLQGLFTSMVDTSALMLPFQTVMMQIQAATTKETMELMKSLMEVMQSTAVQDLLKLGIQFLNDTLAKAADIIDLLGTIGEFFNKLPGFNESFTATLNIMTGNWNFAELKEELADVKSSFDTAAIGIHEGALSFGEGLKLILLETFDALLEALGIHNEALQAAIDELRAKAEDYSTEVAPREHTTKLERYEDYGGMR